MTTWIKEATDTTISSTVTGQITADSITADSITADSLDVDNVNIDGNTITTTDTNGNIIIAPDGTGDIIMDTLMVDTSANRIGIGTTSPDGNLHISSLTDATFILEADTDNEALPLEADNPRIEMRQDGNAVNGYLGIEGKAGSLYTNSLDNSVYLEAKNNSTATSNIQFVTGGDLDAPSDGTARMTVTAAGQVGIGTNTPSTNADLTLENGVLNLKETTTPSADTNYGKIYTKSDNKLWFQDGGGNTYTIDITLVSSG